MIHVDAPYGLGVADWDDASWDQEDWAKLFKQIAAASENLDYYLFVWDLWLNLPKAHAAMKAAGYVDVMPIYWYKFNQNQTSKLAFWDFVLLLME